VHISGRRTSVRGTTNTLQVADEKMKTGYTAREFRRLVSNCMWVLIALSPFARFPIKQIKLSGYCGAPGRGSVVALNGQRVPGSKLRSGSISVA
jgi:hypothetical protein